MLTGNPKGTSIPLLQSDDLKIPTYNTTGEPKTKPSAPPVPLTIAVAVTADYNNTRENLGEGKSDGDAPRQGSGDVFPRSRRNKIAMFITKAVDAINKTNVIAMEDLKKDHPYHQLIDEGSRHSLFSNYTVSTRVPMKIGYPTEAIEYLKNKLERVNGNDDGRHFRDVLAHLHYWRQRPGLHRLLKAALEDIEKKINGIITNNLHTTLATIQKTFSIELIAENSIGSSSTGGELADFRNNTKIDKKVIMRLWESLENACNRMNRSYAEHKSIKTKITLNDSTTTYHIPHYDITCLILGKPNDALSLLEKKLKSNNPLDTIRLLRHLLYWMEQPNLPPDIKSTIKAIETALIKYIKETNGGSTHLQDEKNSILATHRQLSDIVTTIRQLEEAKCCAPSGPNAVSARIVNSVLFQNATEKGVYLTNPCCGNNELRNDRDEEIARIRTGVCSLLGHKRPGGY